MALSVDKLAQVFPTLTFLDYLKVFSYNIYIFINRVDFLNLLHLSLLISLIGNAPALVHIAFPTNVAYIINEHIN